MHEEEFIVQSAVAALLIILQMIDHVEQVPALHTRMHALY
jgi:hypothetical protein